MSATGVTPTPLYAKQNLAGASGLGLAGTFTGANEITQGTFIQLQFINADPVSITVAGLLRGATGISSNENADIYGSNTLGAIGTRLTTRLATFGTEQTYRFTNADLRSYKYFSVTASGTRSAGVLIRGVAICGFPGATQ